MKDRIEEVTIVSFLLPCFWRNVLLFLKLCITWSNPSSFSDFSKHVKNTHRNKNSSPWCPRAYPLHVKRWRWFRALCEKAHWEKNWVSLDSIPCETIWEMEMYKLTHLTDSQNKLILHLNGISINDNSILFALLWFNRYGLFQSWGGKMRFSKCHPLWIFQPCQLVIVSLLQKQLASGK